ncbi:ketoacyl-ACP synthase III [Carnobacterium pleistocenium]|uniref:ketoacyl-ACP synthase III n=1 Tax=Carnobacterium pleistocenium TaxID=181073 RepID=UPI0005515038|nr:ketoacyl-ACP synthase III [Carnobacterium pleistocenium]
MTSIRIKSIAIHHPANKVENDFYIDHFKNLTGKDHTKFLKDVLGRDSRHIIDNDDENTVTMAIEASNKVLKKSGVLAKDLDMIMFTTQVPEYIFPTNASMLHRGLQASSNTGILDLNANCSGMTVALDQASRYLMSNPRMNKLLLVGSDHASLIMNPTDSLTYPAFGDIAVALILERVEEENTGLIDSIYHTTSSHSDMVTFPKNGLSKALKSQEGVKYVQWLPFDGGIAMPPAYKIIDELLERNNLTPNEIKAYCLSQFSIANVNRMQEHYGLEKEKMIYIGDKYGYSGTSSPLLAFYEGIEQGTIKRGDKVLLWTVGVGYNLIAVLYQY